MKNNNIVPLICHSSDWLSLNRGGTHFVLGVGILQIFFKLKSVGHGVVHFPSMRKQLYL